MEFTELAKKVLSGDDVYIACCMVSMTGDNYVTAKRLIDTENAIHNFYRRNKKHHRQKTSIRLLKSSKSIPNLNRYPKTR